MIISQLRRFATCTAFILAVAFSTANAGFLYVLNGQGSTGAWAYGFHADPETGVLTPLAGSPVAAGSTGTPFFLNESMAVDSRNRRLYVLNDGPNTLSVYAIDAATGALTEMPYSPLQLAAANWGTVNVHPSGSPVVAGGMLSGFSGIVSSFVFAEDSVNAATGSPFSTGMATPFSGAFSRDGAYYYTGGFTVFSPYIAGFSVDAATGVLTALPGSAFDAGGPRPAGFSTDAAGRLFVVDNNNAMRVFTTAAGLPTAVSGNPFSANTGAVDTFVHPGGEFIFVAGRLGNQVSAFRIAGDGSSTLPTGTSTVGSGGAFANMLAMGRDGRFLYVANSQSRSVSTIGFDAATGGLSFMNVQPDNTAGTAGSVVRHGSVRRTGRSKSAGADTRRDDNRVDGHDRGI